ncbi:MAG: DinB family protein [Acidobacteriia bacterium]|nr:DinB family protein [Terriglobia bacterium]
MNTRIRVVYLFLAAVAVTHGQRSGSLAADARSAWAGIAGNVVKAAEKMPEEHYSFKPTQDVRSFGQLIGHVTDANYLFCSAVNPEKRNPPDAEKKLSSKTDLVAALKESVAYCNAAFERVADAQAAAPVKLFGGEKATLSVLYMNVAHANEHYGNIVTYLRLKGIVPPSSEPRAAAVRLYFDRAHGELPVPAGMSELAKKLDLEIVAVEQPVSAGSIDGSRLLYFRAPSKAFTEAEKAAVVGFVKKGGALLLVLDEEKRQQLSTTGVNDLISPFGMRLTPDTAYLPNAGAIALAGEINRANREIPYDGGRAVEGGTPFAFQLDKQGNPSQPYASWKKVEGGGRIVVMAEGMASLFMGSAAGQRLTPATGHPDSIYFGKDSAIFMEEVLSWLVTGNA